MIKYLWILAGFVSLALGIIGIFLPLLPTTVFILLAGFCWAKSSERLYAKLSAHPTFGKMLSDWQQRRAMPRYAKYLAVGMMVLSVGGLFFRFWGSDTVIWVWVAAVFCLAVGVWMWRLPDA